MTLRRAPFLLAALLAAAVAVPSGTAAARGPIARATSLLNGKRLTRFVDTGSIGVASSYDQRLHFCSNGRFIFDTVSNLGDVTEPRVTRTTGRWRVVSASFSGSRGIARVRGVPDSGRPVVIVIASGRSGTTVGGNSVIVERSDLCR